LLFDIVPYLLARESAKGGNPFNINQDFPQNCLVSGTRDMISTHLPKYPAFLPIATIAENLIAFHDS
jgi:hypothetical protein